MANSTKEFTISYVRIEGLRKQFAGKAGTVAIDDLFLEVNEGELVVLLGPSGCGKTTTLRCIAGLETADAGRISFGERVAFDSKNRVNLAPNRRNLGMVFQSYALWPHMTVRQNIAYPLRARGMREEIGKGWVDDAAKMVECTELLSRYPSQLSGGQQQRVALARGLVSRPDLVLFDEPLSNLDARLRNQVRAELHELHQREEFTAVFVTHDQSEALALGDRMAIMRAGNIEQFDTPSTVFERPATEYVAAFVGMSNRLECVYRGESWWCGSAQITSGGPTLEASTDRSCVLRMHPDAVRLVYPSDRPASDEMSVTGRVLSTEFGGRHIDVMADVGGTRVHSRMPAGRRDDWIRALLAGTAVTIAFAITDIVVFEASLDGELADHSAGGLAEVSASV